MSTTVSIPFEFDGKAAAQQLQRVEDQVKGIGDASRDLGQKFNKAFAFDQIGSAIGRTASRFKGLTSTVIQGASDIAGAFAAAGPLGGAIAGTATLVQVVVDKLNEQEKAAKDAAKAITDEFAKANAALTEQAKLQLVVSRLTEQARLVRLGFSQSESVGLTQTFDLQTKLNKLRADAGRDAGEQAKLEESLANRRVRLAAIEVARFTASYELKKRFTEDEIAQGVRAAKIFGDLSAVELGSEAAAEEARIAADKAAIDRLKQRIPLFQGEIRGTEDLIRGTQKRVSVEQQLAQLLGKTSTAKKEEAEETLDFSSAINAETAERIRLEEAFAAQQERRLDAFRQAEEKNLADAQRRLLLEQQIAETQKKAADANQQKNEQEEQAFQRRQLQQAQFAAAQVQTVAAVLAGIDQSTKEQLQQRAKIAAFEAAFQAATGLGLLAVGNPGAAVAFASAKTFAGIAAAQGIASLFAESAPESAAPAQGGGFGGGFSTGGGGTGSTTVVIQGTPLITRAEIFRAVADANRGARRLGYA